MAIRAPDGANKKQLDKREYGRRNGEELIIVTISFIEFFSKTEIYMISTNIN